MEPSTDVLSTKLKQRAVIEFLTAENVNPTDIHRRLKAVYGNKTVDRSTVSRWVSKYKLTDPGKINILDKHGDGRPVTVMDEKHRIQVDELIKNDRQITQNRIADIVGMSQERVGFIIQQLGYRKICARWVPKMLTQENKKIRVECSQKLLNRYHQEGEQFLLKIVTDDETWVHHYDPEEKRQSMEYRHVTSPSPKNSRFSLLQERLCLRTAPKQLKFEVLQHPPYSPDLAPCDFHFFSDLKRDLKGTHFTSDEEVNEAVKSWIKERPATYFSDGMKKLNFLKMIGSAILHLQSNDQMTSRSVYHYIKSFGSKIESVDALNDILIKNCDEIQYFVLSRYTNIENVIKYIQDEELHQCIINSDPSTNKIAINYINFKFDKKIGKKNSMTQKFPIQNQKHLDKFSINSVYFFNNSPFFKSETLDITQNIKYINSIQEIDCMLLSVILYNSPHMLYNGQVCEVHELESLYRKKKINGFFDDNKRVFFNNMSLINSNNIYAVDKEFKGLVKQSALFTRVKALLTSCYRPLRCIQLQIISTVKHGSSA
ncbi:hypothetical protein QTP88_010594 [Uroleucon formosanum]